MVLTQESELLRCTDKSGGILATAQGKEPDFDVDTEEASRAKIYVRQDASKLFSLGGAVGGRQCS